METSRTALRVPFASIEVVLGSSECTLIDLRAPSEFAIDHLPGAINLPLFDDVERALIGTLYVQTSPTEAFERAREFARERIVDLARDIGRACDWELPSSDLVARLEQMTEHGLASLERSIDVGRIDELPERAVVFNCWRGGLRSRSVTAFVRALGLERAVLVEGGYKAYRKEVARTIDEWSGPPFVVLRGLTGSGKTLVLQAIERRRPGWTIDLEELAGHRSSILGMVGRSPSSQKSFESGIAAALRGSKVRRRIVEGESRKVGDAIIPENLWRAIDGGIHLELVTPLETRIDVLLADYLSRSENRGELARQLPFVEARLGPRKWAGVLVKMLDQRRDRELVRVLLELYYDPLYAHSEKHREYVARFEAGDVERCADEIVDWIEARGLTADGC